MPEKALCLIKKDPDLLKEIVISAYLDEIISLGKAAEVLGVTREELIEEFKKRGIPSEPPTGKTFSPKWRS